MRQPLLGVLAVLAATTGAAGREHGDPWDGAAFEAPAAAIAQAARAVPTRAEHPVSVFLAETELRYEADGRCVRRERLVYRVESQDGRDSWNTIDAGWAPWHQARPEVRARVIGPDGRESALDPATVLEAGVDETDEQIFSDRREVSAPLPALVVGSVVEYQTVVRDETPWFPAGVVSRLYLHRGGPTRLSRIVVDAPAATRVRWSARLLGDVKPRREERDGRVRLTFEATDLPAFEVPESNLPPDAPRWPHLVVSTGESWTDVARAYSELVEKQLAGADVSALVKEAGGRGDRRAVVQRLLARVDGIRYTSVQLGDAAFVPRTPRDVLARGYGDCKDKATLLVSLLRSAGIPASVALLSSGYDEDVPEDTPGMGLFNHAIVYVPGPPDMWIDPTVERSRAGELPLNDQGRRALVARPDTKGLGPTPETTAADNGTVETREFNLSEMGPARVVETTEYRGAYDRHFRRELGAGDAAKRRAEYEQYVRTEYLAEALGTLDEGRAEDLDQAFRVRVEAMRARRGSTDEREGVVAYFPGRVAGDVPPALAPVEEGKTDPPARRSDFFFATPYFVEHRYRIVPPPGFAVHDLPPPEELALGPARYEARWTQEPTGLVSGTIRFESGPRRITAEQFQALRDSLKTLRARPAAVVRFAQKGEAHLAEGRVREALAEFDQLARQHPKEALHRTQRALALLKGGMAEAARDEARRAVAVEPTSVIAHRRLGWVLQHDLIGRRFAKGADLPGAKAAHRKAVELAPEDAPTRANLAYLLEFNDQGEQYGPGADLAGAAEQYWRLAREDKTPYTNLPLVLLRAGRYAELQEAARTLEAGQRDSFEVLAAAAQDGVKAAVARAARIAQVDDRRRALEESADQLLRIRRYADAAALLQEAAQGSPNASAMRGRAELIARVRRHEPSDAVEPGPEGVVRTFIRGLLFGWDDARLLGLFHEAERHREGVESYKEPLAPVREIFDRERRKTLLPAEVFADLTLSIAELATEGDDHRGYRVRFRNPQAGIQIVYVVKGRGGYVMLGSSANLEALGDEALRRVAANDVEGARVMLDWAREELSPAADDPFAEPRFPHFWTAGQAGGADAIRIASATLLVLSRSTAAEGVQILQAARGLARDDEERAHFDVALQAGYARLGRWADALAASDSLADRLEASASLRSARAFALHRVGRSADL
ncbi:MAG TPA: DUF3857 domain-containing protein, partial [Vicinamibacteria bacterium]|nr:DUF3857 domain-containing protein [Vicinamibacteria bacterium]